MKWRTTLFTLNLCLTVVSVARAEGPSSVVIDRMKDIQKRYGQDIMGRPGVYALGIGLDDRTENAVFRVLVDEQAVLPELPAALDGFPLLVQRGTPPVANNGGPICIPCHANQLSLPVQTGNSGLPNNAGPCGSCTMGFKACRPSDGAMVWLTSAHCAQDATTCPGSAPLGSVSTHVSLGELSAACAPASNVGTLSSMMPPFPFGLVDVAAVASDASLTQSFVRDIGLPDTTVATPALGMSVQKSGRTTGLTTGTVMLVGALVNISYNCGSIILGDQFLVVGGNSTCAGGDSGAGWFTRESPPQVVGLHTAGDPTGITCWANEAANALGFLGLTMDPSDCVVDSCPLLLASGSSSGSDSDPIADDARRLRDAVLGQTELGKGWIRTYYDVAKAWTDLYLERPILFGAATEGLLQNASVLSAVANAEAVTVPQAQLSGVVSLLNRHIAASSDPQLRAAFQMWRGAIQNPSIQALFKVTVK